MDEENRPPPPKGDFLFKKVIEKLAGDRESNAKITAHVRAVTGIGALPAANAAMTVEQEKVDLWGDCFRALCLHAKGNADAFSELKGQTMPQGQATAEPEKVVLPPKPVVAPEPDEDEVEGAPLEPVRKPVPSSDNPLVQAMLDVILPHIQQQAAVDTSEVNAIARSVVDSTLIEKMTDLSVRLNAKIDEYLAKVPARCVVEVRPYEKKSYEIPRQHYKFELLVAALRAKCNVILVGPAGTGKSTTVQVASELFGKELDRKSFFEALSIGQMTSKSDLFGFTDANGKYHETGLVRCGRDGGIFLADELDAGNAGVMTQINMITANGHFSTPLGLIVKSDHFRFVGTANTYGMGGNRVYVGRNQLDAATLDRFVVIDWDCDEGLEASFIGVEKTSPRFKLDEGGILEPDEWIERVHKLRAAADKLAIRQLFTPRASIHGAALFGVGVGVKHVEEMTLWKGCEPATKAKLLQEARLN